MTTDEKKKQRRKASRASEAFAQMTEAPKVVGGEAVLGAGPAGGPAGEAVEPVRRFTARFYSYGDTDALDRWLSEARKIAGRKVDASRLVRELIRELAADPALSARIHARLRDPEQPAD